MKETLWMTRDPLIAIARCGEVDKARVDRNHPCHQVVTAHVVGGPLHHVAHVHEPWSGRSLV